MKSKIIIKNSSAGFTLVEMIVVMAVFLMIIGGAVGIFLSIIANQRRILSEQEILNQTSYIEEYMSKALRMATKDGLGNCLVDVSMPSRETHPGYSYLLTRQVTDGANTYYTGIKFLNQSNLDSLGKPICQEFYLDNSDLSHPVLTEIKIDSPYETTEYAKATITPLSSQTLGIRFIKFGLDGTNGSSAAGKISGDQDSFALGTDYTIYQPRVSIALKVKLQGGSQNVKHCDLDSDCSSGLVCDLPKNICVATRTIQTTVSQRNLNAK